MITKKIGAQMAKSKSYQTSLQKSLKDPNEAIEYLNAALEEKEPEVFLLALRDVVDSYGGISKLAASTLLNRENLYRMLSTKGNPEFFSLLNILNTLGFRLAVQPQEAVKSSNDKGITGKIILFPNTRFNHIDESPSDYALAADTRATSNSSITFMSEDNQEVGILNFDYRTSALFLQLTGDISLGKILKAEIITKDNKIISGELPVEDRHRLVLCKKERIFPRDVAQITLSTEV
jgi:probable addiction module antidote protein